MPRGDKSNDTDKQKRRAEHIEEGYEDRRLGKNVAERGAWATVNKENGGGNKSGSGRGAITFREESPLTYHLNKRKPARAKSK
jgi:hypothetical protein